MKSDFDRRKVYDLLLTIPRGRVVTYGRPAALLGNRRLARAVGGALHHNPDGDKYPFHTQGLRRDGGAFFRQIPYPPVSGSRKSPISGAAKVNTTKSKAIPPRTATAALGNRHSGLSVLNRRAS